MKMTSTRDQTAGAHLARVLAVTGRTATVEVPAVARGHQYLGVRYPDHLFDSGGGATGLTASGGSPPHQHAYGRPLSAGDAVLVVYVAGAPVITTRLA